MSEPTGELPQAPDGVILDGKVSFNSHLTSIMASAMIPSYMCVVLC